MYPEIIALDRNVESKTDAESLLREGLQDLSQLRMASGDPAVCE